MESNQIGESNNNKFENINSQRKEKNFGLSGKDENPKEKKNSNNEEISFSKYPKKLNIELIFKNLNIGSKINAEKRKEIIEVAQHNIEDKIKMELKEKQIECDNELDNEENKNEEEEIEERNINNRISIDKDKQEEKIEEETIDNSFPNAINEQEKSKEVQNEYKYENYSNKNISIRQNEEDNKIIKNNKVFANNKTNENNTLKRKRTISENNQQFMSFLKKKLEDIGQNNNFKENVKTESRNINENNNCENSEINNEFNQNNQNLNLENKVKSNTNLSVHMNVQDQENEIQEKFNKSMGFNFKNDKDINERDEYLDRPREFRNTLYFPSLSSIKSRTTLNEQNNNDHEKIDAKEIFLEKLHIPKNTISKNKTFCEIFF